MKILITTFTYFPNADGCAQAATVRANGLAALGHEVTVATSRHPARVAGDSNPRVISFDITGSSNRKFPVKGDVAAFQQFLAASNYDVILFENWDAWPTCLAVDMLQSIKGKKILVSHGYTPHIWVPHPGIGWGLGNWLGGLGLLFLTPYLMDNFDHMVFLSSRTDFGRFLDHRMAQHFAAGKFSIIPNGAFANEFQDDGSNDFRSKYGIQGPMLLSVAAYCDRKNQKLAIRAFREAALADATLVLIGNEFNEYSEEARQLDADLQKRFPAGRVLFLEKMSRREICAAYVAADLFVLAAKAETLPVVLLESMASRTAWVSTDTGCVSELPGGLVAKHAGDLVKKIRQLISSASDRDRLAQAGWKACQEKYDWNKVISAYDTLIHNICDNAEARPLPSRGPRPEAFQGS